MAVDIDSGVGIFSGGVKGSGGTMVSSGAVINAATVNAHYDMRVGSAGLASGTTVNQGGVMYVAEAGRADNTRINYLASMYVYSGGEAVGNTIANMGIVHLSGGTAVSNAVGGGGFFVVSHGGLAVSTTVAPQGIFRLVSGGSASGVTVAGAGKDDNSGETAGGSMYVGYYGAGTAENVYVSSGGGIHVYQRGRISNVTVAAGGMVNHGMRLLSGNYYDSALRISNAVLETSGYIYDGQEIDQLEIGATSRGVLKVFSGAVVSRAVVNSFGSMNIGNSQGGTAFATVISSGGRVTVTNGGGMVDTTILSGGTVAVSAGGRLESVDIQTSALAAISGGTVQSAAVSGGGELSLVGGTACEVTLAGDESQGLYGTLSVASSGCAADITVLSGGYLYERSGRCENLYINGGAAYVDNGRGATVENGRLSVAAGGVFSGATVGVSGRMNTVFSGGVGSAVDTVVQSAGELAVMGYAGNTQLLFGATMSVGGNGVAEATSVGTGALMTVMLNGSAVDTTVAGTMRLFDFDSGVNSAVVSGTTVVSGGLLAVDSGFTADDTDLTSGGAMEIAANGSAVRVFVDQGGALLVSSGGALERAVVASGGTLTLEDGAALTADQRFGGSVVVTAGTATCDMAGSAIVMDVAGRETEDGVIVSGRFDSFFRDAEYTVNFADGQAAGSYALADDATNFAAAIRLTIDDVDTRKLLAVGGAMIYNRQKFSFTVEDDRLIADVTSGYGPAARCDFNETGISDVVTFNSASRTVNVLMDQPDGSWTGRQIGGAVTDSSWEYHGTAYIDADNVQDVIWVHSVTGEVGVWLVQGDSFAHQTVAGATEDWHFLGAADVTGDGRDNLLWQHDGGTVLAWASGLAGSMNDNLFLGGADPNEWTFQGAGDFTGDGKADVLWRNQLSGLVGCWDSSDGGWHSFGGVGDDWTFLGAGDFNADGVDGVLWLNDSGLVGSWDVSGDGVEWCAIGATADLGSGYSFAGIGDFNGDGVEDILWRGAADCQAWLMEEGRIKSTLTIA